MRDQLIGRQASKVRLNRSRSETQTVGVRQKGTLEPACPVCANIRYQVSMTAAQ